MGSEDLLGRLAQQIFLSSADCQVLLEQAAPELERHLDNS